MHRKVRVLLALIVALVAAPVCHAGVIVKEKTWSVGEVLKAANLNGVFDQLFNLVNGTIETDNITDGTLATADYADDSITDAKISDTFPRVKGYDLTVSMAPSLANSQTTVNVTATVMGFEDTNGDWIIIEDVAESPNMTANLMVGISEATATFYTIWCLADVDENVTPMIAAFDDDTFAELTMPGTYTHADLVGSVYNDASGHLEPARREGNEVSYERLGADTTNDTFDNTWTDISATARLPIGAIGAYLHTELQAEHNSDANNLVRVDFSVIQVSDGNKARLTSISTPLINGNMTTVDQIYIPVDYRQSWSHVWAETNPATSEGLKVYVIGYRDNIH